MKPLARVLISRQRLYEKKCNSSDEDGSAGNNNFACKTGDWSEWSECDVKCGKGKKYRQRNFLDSDIALRNKCKTSLTQRKECKGTDCDEEEEEESNQNDPDNKRVDPECALTEWGEWSDCTETCGKGTRVKSRKYKKRGSRKRCMNGMTKPPELQMTESCTGDVCGGEITPLSVVDNNNCKLSPWNDFSECDASCQRHRSRKIINRGFGVQRYGVHRSSPMYDKIYGNQNDDDVINDPDHPCYRVILNETVSCGPTCQSLPEFCMLDPDPGQCRNSIINRWYYVSRNNNCSLFAYGGCGGNENSFGLQSDCLAKCRRKGDYGDLEIHDQHKFEEKTDCKVTNWIRGPCSVSCGSGTRTKTRTIIKHPLNGGRECPKKFKRFERCEIRCGPAYDTNPSWGPTTIQVTDNCEYTNWGPWSSCSQTCGNDAKQQRTRHVTDSEYALYCNDRVETRSCNAMPCRL